MTTAKLVYIRAEGKENIKPLPPLLLSSWLFSSYEEKYKKR
jgi:hypothetical protein